VFRIAGTRIDSAKLGQLVSAFFEVNQAAYSHGHLEHERRIAWLEKYPAELKSLSKVWAKTRRAKKAKVSGNA